MKPKRQFIILKPGGQVIPYGKQNQSPMQAKFSKERRFRKDISLDHFSREIAYAGANQGPSIEATVSSRLKLSAS